MKGPGIRLCDVATPLRRERGQIGKVSQRLHVACLQKETSRKGFIKRFSFPDHLSQELALFSLQPIIRTSAGYVAGRQKCYNLFQAKGLRVGHVALLPCA